MAGSKTRRTIEEKEKIVAEIENEKAQGIKVVDACRSRGIWDATYRLWKQEIKAGGPIERPATSGTGRAKRYTQSERFRLMVEIKKGMASGLTARAACAAMGVAASAYYGWIKKYEGKTAPNGNYQRIELQPLALTKQDLRKVLDLDLSDETTVKLINELMQRRNGANK